MDPHSTKSIAVMSTTMLRVVLTMALVCSGYPSPLYGMLVPYGRVITKLLDTDLDDSDRSEYLNQKKKVHGFLIDYREKVTY